MAVQFYTDPAQYIPNTDAEGALLLTEPRPSVQNVGRQIPDTIIAMPNRYQRVTLTAAQLLALKTTDVTIQPLPATVIGGPQGKPGPGLAYVLDNIHMRINFGGTAYTLNAGTLKLYMGPSANALPFTADLSALLTAGATQDIVNIPILQIGPAVQANVENQPIVVGNQGTANFTLGNGTLDIIVGYNVVQM